MHSQLHAELGMRVPAKWHKKVVILQRQAVTQYVMDDEEKKEIPRSKAKRIFKKA